MNANCEVFDIKANRWIEVYDNMKKYRTAHSLCEISGVFGRFVYAFGGLDERDKSLDSIERLQLGSGDLESTFGAATWELLGDIRLPLRLCNVGCYTLSQGEILLFGGVSTAEKQQWGQVLEVKGASNTHSLRPERIDLAMPDVFPNTTQIVQVSQGQASVALIQGK